MAIAACTIIHADEGLRTISKRRPAQFLRQRDPHQRMDDLLTGTLQPDGLARSALPLFISVAIQGIVIGSFADATHDTADILHFWLTNAAE